MVRVKVIDLDDRQKRIHVKSESQENQIKTREDKWYLKHIYN